MWRPLISGPPTLIKSPLHPQPYCSSSVLPLSSRGRLAAIVPRLTGTSLARIQLAERKKQAALSDSHIQHTCSSPLARAERPTVLSPARPASSRCESDERSAGSLRSAYSASCSRRRRDPLAHPSRGIAPSRRTTVTLPHTGRLGHAQTSEDDGPHGDNENHTTRPNSPGLE